MIEISEFIVEKVEGTNAILVDIHDQKKILWPIDKLPAETNPGQKIRFKILSDQDVEIEHQIIARKLLEEMIN